MEQQGPFKSFLLKVDTTHYNHILKSVEFTNNNCKKHVVYIVNYKVFIFCGFRLIPAGPGVRQLHKLHSLNSARASHLVPLAICQAPF